MLKDNDNNGLGFCVKFLQNKVGYVFCENINTFMLKTIGNFFLNKLGLTFKIQIVIIDQRS